MNRALLLVAVSCCSLVTACDKKVETPAPAAAPSPAVTELQKLDTVVGSGAPIAEGQVAVVHYTGWLYDPAASDQKGKEFDSSRTRGTPFRFPIGGGQVIQGWDQGVVGMQVGGQRRLVIPASLGYGERGAGGGLIPPNAALLFEVELLGIEEKS
jgi:FKBP-type peptidyl-prolyl cis-trans isomerase FkpA